MDSNVLTHSAVLPRRNVKRLRRCLNPQCLYVAGGGKMPLKITRIGEYTRLGCSKCGSVSVFNPVATVRPDKARHIFVARDRGGVVEHIFPKARVLVP